MGQQQPMAMSPATMSCATERAKYYVETVIERAHRISTDADRKEPLASQECKGCFYSGPRMGCAAITSRDCMCCHQKQTYGSTNTDVLCMPCAKDNQLCKHCGGDLELRVRRRNWPKAYAEETAPAESGVSGSAAPREIPSEMVRGVA